MKHAFSRTLQPAGSRKVPVLKMGRIGMFCIAGFGVLGVGQAQAQANYPETVVCKETYNAYYSITNYYQYYPIVGETSHPGCSAIGKNAWIVRALNTGATVCNVPQNNLTSLARGYDIVSEVFNEACPVQLGNRGGQTVRLATNAVTLQIKPNPGTVSWAQIPMNYFPITFVSPTPTVIVKAADSANEYTCRWSLSLGGYVRKGPRTYQPVCDDNVNDDTRMADYIPHAIPGDTETNVYMNGAYPPGYVTTALHEGNYANEVYKNSRWEKIDYYDALGTIEMARSERYTVCELGFNGIGLPTGYRFVEQTESTACYLLHTTTPSYNNKAWVIKRIGDPLESICRPKISFPGSGRGQNIPSGYILASESYAAHCPDWGNDAGGAPISNVWNLRRLEDNDTVCKTVTLPGDYGITGETTMAGCSGAGLNAYKIVKVSGTTTLCNSFNNFSLKLHTLGYVPVGQINMSSCPGTGDNARIIRPVKEPVDVVCADLSYNRPNDYAVESYATLLGCPRDRGAVVRVQYMF